MEIPPASHGFVAMNYKTSPCLMWITLNELKNNPCLNVKFELLPSFIMKGKIKYLPGPHTWGFWITDVMFKYCMPYQETQRSLCGTDIGIALQQ